MHEVIGLILGNVKFFLESEFLVYIAKIWYIPITLEHVLGISLNIHNSLCIYMKYHSTYTQVMVQTCIYQVYTFIILYMIIYTDNIQQYTMYIR